MSSQNILEKLIDFPRIFHLPHKPNAQRSDLIASQEDVKVIFDNEETIVEEKLDAANSGILFSEEGNFSIRNRNNILNKGKTGHLRGPAKMQFAPIYNWAYENRDKFETLNNNLGFEVSVFGEWMVALHGVKYDKLPSWFIPYELYDWEHKKFISHKIVRKSLQEAGFVTVPLLHEGRLPNWEIFDKFCAEKSPYSTTDLREGVVVKVSDEKYLTHRFKMVRRGFIQGCHWNERALTKNKLCD
jgi:hypothetical protein